MDRLDNEDIGVIWSRHYPKRTERESSMSLCITLAMIIKQRAKSADQYSDWPAKIEHVLSTAHISKEEFDMLESESKAKLG